MRSGQYNKIVMSIAGDVGFRAVVTPSLGVDVAKGGEFLLVTNGFFYLP